jgi:hypothetical protein
MVHEALFEDLFLTVYGNAAAERKTYTHILNESLHVLICRNKMSSTTCHYFEDATNWEFKLHGKLKSEENLWLSLNLNFRR